jgi:hypothetical protein
VAEHHDERRVERLHRIFEAGDDVVAREIACDTTDEDVAGRGIEAKFRSDPRIGASNTKSMKA